MIFRLPAVRYGAVAALVFSAALIAGCGGGGGGSSSTPAATPTPTAAPSASPSASPSSSAQAQWNFPAGFGANNAILITGGTIAAGNPLNGVTVATTWGAATNVASGTIAMTSGLGAGNGDITPVGSAPAWPVFGSSTGPVQDQNGNSLGSTYSIVIYTKLTATPDTIFATTPAVTVTVGAPSSIAGKTACALFSLNGVGSGYVWKQAITSNAPSGGSFTFSAQTLSAGNTVEVGNASSNQVTYLAFACK